MWLILLALVFPQEELDNVFNRLSDKGQRTIICLSTEINPAKSAGIQYRLLREHLIWLDYRNTSQQYKRQIIIISVLSFHKAIGLFEKQIKEIEEEVEAPDEKQVKWISETRRFIERAKEVIEKDFKELGEITDCDLQFPSI